MVRRRGWRRILILVKVAFRGLDGETFGFPFIVGKNILRSTVDSYHPLHRALPVAL